MTDLQIEEVVEVDVEGGVLPDTGNNYCHIEDGSKIRFYCGRLNEHGGLTCKPYNGEAICPSCGAPTCPECAAIADLNTRLEETESSQD